MKRLMAAVAISATAFLHGCATSHSSGVALTTPNVAASVDSPAGAANAVSGIALCAAAEGCGQPGQAVVRGTAIAVIKDAPTVEGHPLTSVVVTQCNLVVVVYMTMPDGRLLRFDKGSDIPADQLVSIAYTATRSERVEVSCEGLGTAGYETHVPS
jgi:hypothetical protein